MRTAINFLLGFLTTFSIRVVVRFGQIEVSIGVRAGRQ